MTYVFYNKTPTSLAFCHYITIFKDMKFIDKICSHSSNLESYFGIVTLGGK